MRDKLSHFLPARSYGRTGRLYSCTQDKCNARCTRTPTFAPLRWAKRASARNRNFCTPDACCASVRAFGATLRQYLFCNICYILTDTFHLSTLYRDTRNAHKTLYPDGKKCAIPLFVSKSGNTTSLYCRAVIDKILEKKKR